MGKFNGLSEEVRSVIRENNPEQYKGMVDHNAAAKRIEIHQNEKKPVKHINGTITGRRF